MYVPVPDAKADGEAQRELPKLGIEEDRIMSELKARGVDDVYIEYYTTGKPELAKVYLKSEADNVIAELKDKIQQKDFFWEGCGFSKMGFKNTIDVANYVEELKKEKEYVIEQTAEVINGQEKELRHQKYKRCLAMARWCERKRIDAADYRIPRDKWEFYDRWHKRWLAIAEKFKETK